VTLNWFGLTAGVRYMGDIGFVGEGVELGHTLVSIGPEPQAINGLMSGRQSEPARDGVERKAGAGVGALDDCPNPDCDPQSLMLFQGASQLD